MAGDLSNTSVDEEGNVVAGNQDVLNESGEIISGTFPHGTATITDGWDNNAAGDYDDDITIKFADGTTISGLSLLDNKGIQKRVDNKEVGPDKEVADDTTASKISALSGGTPSD
jgi:hypothetical protein